MPSPLFLENVTLENARARLVPLQDSDFESLHAVAADPLIWEQHPNRDRYKREVFQTYFEGALLSRGAWMIFDKTSGELAGSTRFYDRDEKDNSIFIGYTFLARKFWGSGLNPQVKHLMLERAFQQVDRVKFHVGKDNLRSRKAMERLGAELQGEILVAYFGEATRTNVEYWISRENWLAMTAAH
jgi:RimJ/RimL family protein N-acetyltransferase